MSVVTISWRSYSRGGEVAQKVAQTLGYRCIAREVIMDASRAFKLPEAELSRAIHHAPSLLARVTDRNEKYIACFKAALLRQLRLDHVVYHGPAGHFFVEGVPHALKVGIIADTDDRVKTWMKRRRVGRDEALRILESDDEQRRQWGFNRYGIDTADISLYDLMIHIRDIPLDEAAGLICRVVRLEPYRTTRRSQKVIEDLTLAAEVKAALLGIDLNAEVHADNGFVEMAIRVPPIPAREKKELVQEMKVAARSVRGVRWVEVKTVSLVKGHAYYSH